MSAARTWSENPSDLDLAAAAARGEADACRELAARLLAKVRKTVSYLVGPGADVDDFTQLAMMRILGASHTFRGESRLEYWAHRITTRLVIRELSAKKQHEPQNVSPQEPLVELAAVASEGSTEEAVLDSEMRRRLGEMLGALSVEKRTAVVLHHIEGYDIQQIADIMDTKVNTVRDRLRDGRKKLKRKIAADPLFADRLKEWKR